MEARAAALAASLQARDLEIDELRAQITELLHVQHDAGSHKQRSTTRSARCAAEEEGKVDLSHLEQALSKALALQSAAQALAKASISAAPSGSASVARSAPAVCIWGTVHSISSLHYWYKSTSTDAEGAARWRSSVGRHDAHVPSPPPPLRP